MNLPPAGGDANLFRVAQNRFGTVQLGMDQPHGLRQEEKEQGSGKKLGAAEALAREKSGHKSGPKCFTMSGELCGNLSARVQNL
jgi:hypothetical protein